jgi:hypothetical protein
LKSKQKKDFDGAKKSKSKITELNYHLFALLQYAVTPTVHKDALCGRHRIANTCAYIARIGVSGTRTHYAGVTA